MASLDTLDLAHELRREAKNALGRSNLRKLAHIAANELEKKPKVQLKFVRLNWLAILLALVLGVGIALLLDHTLFASAYSCHSYSTGGYTCSHS